MTTDNAAVPASIQLRRLIDGFQVSQALHAVATLGIADLLADGPRTSQQLAERAAVQPEPLYRVLRALASTGVFQELDDEWFALTPLGDCLRSDAPEPLAGYAAYVGRAYHWQAWGHLLEALRTGDYAFKQLLGGSGWDYRRAHPEESAIFDRAMTDLTQRASREILDAYDFGRHTTVMDIGGGRGGLLAAILKHWPHLRGILFDLPHVASVSTAVLEAAGVAARCEIVGASFFDGIPSGADVYVLKTVLHDWDDEQARRILCACRRASGIGGALVLVEWDIGPRNTARDGKFADLEMLVANGGRVRSVDQYAALLSRSGFQHVTSTRTRIGFSVIEAVAA